MHDKVVLGGANDIVFNRAMGFILDFVVLEFEPKRGRIDGGNPGINPGYKTPSFTVPSIFASISPKGGMREMMVVSDQEAPHTSPRTLFLPRLHGGYATPLLRLPRHRVVVVKPALSRVRSQCPTPLSRPLPSIVLPCTSRSPRRGNPHAHRQTMRDVPAHTSPLRSPCPSSFMMTSGNAFESRKIWHIYHAWSSQVVDACTGLPDELCPILVVTLSECPGPRHSSPSFPPPPRSTPLRITSADQQASIFLHQKPKVGSSSAIPFL
ncbi:hypothetical protein K438DRAFT_1986419 [Mycena galopus ATCC 62051]|nr:hypothetical protein K438DRAFT_1986419 [Mycena galopus ATCC 62051]